MFSLMFLLVQSVIVINHATFGPSHDLICKLSSLYALHAIARAPSRQRENVRAFAPFSRVQFP